MNESSTTDADRWPDLAVAGWEPTKKSLHLVLQMLGKLRLALSPTQPNWMFTALLPTARGLTTGPMPYRGAAVQGSLDVFASELVLEHSNGMVRRIGLVPARTVAEIYAELQAALAGLAVRCAITPLPQEVPDTTPLDEDRRPAQYDPTAVVRWFDATTRVAGIFDDWRSHFFGRSGIQVWWGALDVALLLFSGKHVAPPADRGYLMTFDLDAEMMNAGLYYGDAQTAPFFYGYIYPQPAGAAALPMRPHGATWSQTLSEWVLPYDGVRRAADPAGELRAFLDAMYAHCVGVAGWDRAALSYEAPKRRHR